MKMKIGVAGAAGRMGRGIVKAVSEQEDMELVLATDRSDVGGDAGLVAGSGEIGVIIEPPDKLDERLIRSGAEVLVDFTDKDSAQENAGASLSKGIKLVIGTTGLESKAIKEIEALARSNNTPVVLSPNMSPGVNLFFRLAREAATSLGEEYDVEIIEVHHHHKKDAPSGTALKVGEIIARALGRDLRSDGVFGRKGQIGERGPKEIGIHALRAGDVVGEHTVLFAGPGERIEITHRAHSREAFVNGVVKAIRFLADRDDGRVYSTWDVLGIE